MHRHVYIYLTRGKLVESRSHDPIGLNIVEASISYRIRLFKRGHVLLYFLFIDERTYFN